MTVFSPWVFFIAIFVLMGIGFNIWQRGVYAQTNAAFTLTYYYRQITTNVEADKIPPLPAGGIDLQTLPHSQFGSVAATYNLGKHDFCALAGMMYGHETSVGGQLSRVYKNSAGQWIYLAGVHDQLGAVVCASRSENVPPPLPTFAPTPITGPKPKVDFYISATGTCGTKAKEAEILKGTSATLCWKAGEK